MPFPGCIRFNVDGLGFTLKFPSFVYFYPQQKPEGKVESLSATAEVLLRSLTEVFFVGFCQRNKPITHSTCLFFT